MDFMVKSALCQPRFKLHCLDYLITVSKDWNIKLTSIYSGIFSPHKEKNGCKNIPAWKQKISLTSLNGPNIANIMNHFCFSFNNKKKTPQRNYGKPVVAIWSIWWKISYVEMIVLPDQH